MGHHVGLRNPSYAASGWMAPVVVAIGSTILCGVATREVWLRSHNMRRNLLYIVFDEKAAGARLAQANAHLRIKGWAAMFFVFVCLLWTALFLAAEYAFVVPAEKAGMPCGCETWTTRGNNTNQCCHQCSTDVLCLAWSANLKATSPLVNICGPGTKLGDEGGAKNATFSCAADGYWMLVTSFFALFWLLVVKCRRPAQLPPAVMAAHPDGDASAKGIEA